MKESTGVTERHGVSAMQAVLQAIASGASVDDALDLVVERVRVLLNATEVMILLRQGDQLLLRAGHGIEGTHLPRLSFADGTTVESWVVRHNAAIFVSDVTHDPRFHAMPGERRRITALAAVPIRTGDLVAGVLTIGDEHKADFQENGTLLATMADVAGVVVEHDRVTQRACDAAAREFVRDIRHDLRSPLTAINGYAQLVRRRAVRDTRQADIETADIIVEQVRRITAMLDALRDASLVESEARAASLDAPADHGVTGARRH